MAKPLPGLDVPVLNSTGQMNQAWFEYFQGLGAVVKALGIHTSFAISALTPGNTTVAVTTVAFSDTSTLFPPTVHNYTQYSNTNQSISDSFASCAAQLTSIRNDLLAAQTAEGALNSRITVLENKINAVIADLAARFP